MLSIQKPLEGYCFVRFYITLSNIRQGFYITLASLLAKYTFLNNIA